MKPPELLFLHALPLDGSMWAGQLNRLPGTTHMPTLYGLGDGVSEWAKAALKQAQGNRLIVVGISVGGSCAIEVALSAPDRVAALVLIGTKANHRPDPALRDSVIAVLRRAGVATAWRRFWAPLFSRSADERIVEAASDIATLRSVDDIARGVAAFHSRPDRKHALSSIACPVRFVSGAEDVAPGVETSAAQARAVPNGRLHVIADCGHYVPLERPEALRAIISGVIRQIDAL